MAHRPRGVKTLAAAMGVGSTAAAARWWTASAARAEGPEPRAFRPRPIMLVRDQDTFALKLKKFAKDGADKLMVIADFDYTLTPTFTEDGRDSLSTHGVLLRTPALDPAVHEIGEKLFDKYYPIEQSTTLGHDEKLAGIVAWWTAKHETLIQYKLTKHIVKSAVEESDVQLRSGFMSLFDKLTQKNVPTLIFSAGLYDVIHAILDKEYAKTPRKTPPSNVHVVANMLQFNKKGLAVGFEGELVHSMNKNAKVINHTPFWKQCKLEERENLILMGDSLTDANMSDGLDISDDHIIRIGFLNDRVTDKRLRLYLDQFDVVLTNDSSLAPVEELLDEMKTLAVGVPIVYDGL